MIDAVHFTLFARDADAARAFFRDVLELESVDAGGGWLIFAAPPAEIAVHPDEVGGRHELYLMCADIEAALAELDRRGIEVAEPVKDVGWGLLAAIEVPGMGALGIYQPKHASPLS